MANVKYTANLSGNAVEDFFEGGYERGPATPKHLVYTALVSEAQMIFNGKNFKYENGSPFSSGVVEEFRLVDGDGHPIMTFTNAKYDGPDLLAALALGFPTGIAFAMVGDDRLIGSKAADEMNALEGNDRLDGGAGNDELDGGIGKDRLNGGTGNDLLFGGTQNDRLTGGKGSDVFEFALGTGRDVITDFDANGGVGRQDFLTLAGGTEYKERSAHQGRDTILDFADGNTLTLVGVKNAHFSDADIQFTW